ncbi:hypothetical protein [Planktosalinus lacus]|uniref:Uncharacterized protein n=1 Tax=Planktosalinus lacus TaxID=1526573 RepID=A0A8J2Y7S2_9FLAO|nr:hypothetical protein [Planktosalinus lacus]GGD82828.1 hypothetical protein GCM10011312_03760 [Planktosalinus lacus]
MISSGTKAFNIQASLSGYLDSGSNVNYTLYIAKNGTVLPSTAVQTKFGYSGKTTELMCVNKN